MGFALIWHIWWLVAVGGIGAFATFVVFAWRDRDEYVVPAAEVARIDRVNLEQRRAALSLAGSV
jgi:cytochrome o ubiquinol oxidase subunit 1